MNDSTQTITMTGTSVDLGLVPVSGEHLDTLVRCARFAAQVIMEADAADTLSSASVRAVARAHGLAQPSLFTGQFEDVVMSMREDQGDENGEHPDEQVVATGG